MSSSYGTIVGRVIGVEGTPVSGATVAVIGSARPVHDIAAITSSNGVFRFGSVLPGIYRLEARASRGLGLADVRVSAGARANVDIRLDGLNRVVTPADERIKVTNNRDYPWRCVCSLLITTASGSMRIGTGWLAAQRLVITAGHCVYMSEEGGWAKHIEVIPGCNGADHPFGSAIVGQRDLRSVSGWTEKEDPNFDYGAILLPPEQRFGETLGTFGFAPREDAEIRGAILNLSGYPGNGGGAHEGGMQWYTTGSTLEMRPRQITYAIDASSGQGGAPVWIMNDKGERYCVAIHTWSGRGVRVSQEVFNVIAQWAAQAP